MKKTMSAATLAVAIPASALAAPAGGSVPHGCDPEIKRGLAKAQIEAVSRGDDFTVSPPEEVKELSCLENLMNVGAKATFSPPSMGDILGEIEEKACEAAEDAIDRATSGLKGNLSGGGVNQNLFPGVDFEAVSGGVNVGVERGTPPGLSTNFDDAARGTGGFADRVESRRQTLEGLFE